MKRVVVNTVEVSPDFEDLFCMSDLCGRYIKVPGPQDFSFYFSPKDDNPHGIRVKVVFNPERIMSNDFGVLELHGNWEYTPSERDKGISCNARRKMIKFFKKYKVLFAAVWDEVVSGNPVQDYFNGYTSLQDLIDRFYLDESDKALLKDVDSVGELESQVRNHKLFNMQD